MQWQTWSDGRLTMKLSIQYETDEKVGPVVSGWTYAHYSPAGESDTTRKGHITHCETNVKINPSQFKIEFPVGTRIWEDTPGGRRYYVQKADGMAPVDEPSQTRKFTSRPDTAENGFRAPLLYTTIGLVAVFTALAIRKRIL